MTQFLHLSNEDFTMNLNLFLRIESVLFKMQIERIDRKKRVVTILPRFVGNQFADRAGWSEKECLKYERNHGK